MLRRTRGRSIRRHFPPGGVAEAAEGDRRHPQGRVLLLYASDGNFWPVADDLFGAAKMDGYFEIDGRAGMDLRKQRKRFPDLTLMGGGSIPTPCTGGGTEGDGGRDACSNGSGPGIREQSGWMFQPDCGPDTAGEY
mgnify:CR=1 FL=1